MSNVPQKREFIALNLPPGIIKIVGNFIDILKVGSKYVKWIKPEYAHITLHFLGNQNEKTEQKIITLMRSVSGKFGKFDFASYGVDAFPNLNDPRIIFLKCKQINGNGADQLQKELAGLLIKDGFKIDNRRWAPHITLGRVYGKSNANLNNFNANIENIEFSIQKFELMESFLYPSGAEYKKIISCDL